MIYKMTFLNEDDDEKNVFKKKFKSFNIKLNVIFRTFNKLKSIFKFFILNAEIVIVKKLNTIN